MCQRSAPPPTGQRPPPPQWEILDPPLMRVYNNAETALKEEKYRVTEIESKGKEGVAISCCCRGANKGLKEYFMLFLLLY